jgi:serine/threonine protein kinase
VTPDRWREIERLYNLALDQAVGQRAAFLARACQGDQKLLKEVESLLASTDGADAYLEIPAVEIAARRLARDEARWQLAGKTVSHYRILAKLGGLAPGGVYKAHDTRLTRPVVLKFHPAAAGDSQASERFHRDARAASALNHPNIGRLYAIDDFEGVPFVATEFLEGENLKQRMSANPLTMDELLDLAIQIADALDAAHSQGILHRNIQPSNIFVTSRNQVKILGFGLSELLPDLPTPEAAPYISPERARGEILDARSDIFSFGAVLYEMATGRKAFDGATTTVSIRASRLNPDFPPKLQEVLGKGLEIDREVRYQHVSGLRADLKRMKRELDSSRLAAAPGKITRLGRYRITAELGKGGMGAVYQGMDPAIGRTVAIKTILPGELGSPEQASKLRERLLREARAAGALDHPNIVTVFDVGEESGVTYIVVEFIQGVTLDELLRKAGGPVATGRALTILAESARALDYAHARGVVHRDVKPANIMIREDGSVKLADFGIAKLPAAATLTAPGDLAGTPFFLSPEQLRGEVASARSDQFSLAVVAWMLLTGSKPFDAPQLAALLSSILMRDPERNSLLGDESDVVLRRALRKDPLQRFPSCSAFVDALQNSCSGAPPSTPSPRKRRITWITSVSAALVVAAGLMFYMLRSNLPRGTQEQKITGALSTTPPTRPAAQLKVPPPKIDPLPAPGAVKIHTVHGLPYVWIPAGSFQMGCSAGDRDCADDEKPAHGVTISSGFWISQTETTVKAYQQFARASGRPMPSEPEFSGRFLNGGWSDDNQPIVGVAWDDAKTYCESVGLRLPTEAEWEYAARAGDSQPRYGPPNLIAWFADNSGRTRLNSNDLWRNDQAHYVETLKQNENGPHHVGEKAANAFGLRDTLGNVWEWVNDWYEKGYYAHSPNRDPTGPAAGTFRVLRGGSWYNGPRFVRFSPRHPNTPETRSVYNGMRCAGKSFLDKF